MWTGGRGNADIGSVAEVEGVAEVAEKWDKVIHTCIPVYMLPSWQSL